MKQREWMWMAILLCPMLAMLAPLLLEASSPPQTFRQSGAKTSPVGAASACVLRMREPQKSDGKSGG